MKILNCAFENSFVYFVPDMKIKRNPQVLLASHPEVKLLDSKFSSFGVKFFHGYFVFEDLFAVDS
ncbi:MAG: hypothetical protein C4557_11085 [Anaerolineaceae bacterium]|nr:MAG: hypothetical protein C4557_11085 [Anaerolineaceae bacterium]